jgi:hypothetical protein
MNKDADCGKVWWLISSSITSPRRLFCRQFGLQAMARRLMHRLLTPALAVARMTLVSVVLLIDWLH